jgi:hypothetical protein
LDTLRPLISPADRAARLLGAHSASSLSANFHFLDTTSGYAQFMRKLWIGCFVFTAVAFLLQIPPIPGIFLMFVAAPYWSVVAINVGFALMVLDGIFDGLPKLALVFPAIWFAGLRSRGRGKSFRGAKARKRSTVR